MKRLSTLILFTLIACGINAQSNGARYDVNEDGIVNSEDIRLLSDAILGRHSLKMLNKTLTLAIGETQQMKATIVPVDTVSQDVTWTSSDESIATITADGLLTTIATGTVTLTARTNETLGLQDSCIVTIIPRQTYTAELLDQKIMQDFDSTIPAGSYSGITWLGDNRYAIVSDSVPVGIDPIQQGWIEMEINLDSLTGQISSMHYLDYHRLTEDLVAYTSRKDQEGIVYVPSSNSLFVSSEVQECIEQINMDDQYTGRKLKLPEKMIGTYCSKSYGYESLGYSALQQEFWTTTEQGLSFDRDTITNYLAPLATRNRLVKFDADMNLAAQYPYLSDTPQVNCATLKYAFGIPEITVMPDGSLLVMEREFIVAQSGCYVCNKLYQVRTAGATQCSFDTSLLTYSDGDFIPKTKITEWTTQLLFNAANTNIANYEGMCLAPALPDGRIPLLVICDSQNNVGMSGFHLYDYIKVILLTPQDE